MAFTCEICLEQTRSTQKFHHNNRQVVHNYCLECIGKHIRAKVDENRATIFCPKDGCKQTLDPLGCKMLIPRNVFEKWCDCLCIWAVSGIPSCNCPNPNCSELILTECDDDDDGMVGKCMCPRCKNLFCYACVGPWHTGICCPENGNSNEAKFASLVKQKKWKRCPGCGQTIERTKGCPRIRCRCGTFFSYDDGEKIDTRGENFALFFMLIVLLVFVLLYNINKKNIE